MNPNLNLDSTDYGCEIRLVWLHLLTSGSEYGPLVGVLPETASASQYISDRVSFTENTLPCVSSVDLSRTVSFDAIMFALYHKKQHQQKKNYDIFFLWQISLLQNNVKTEVDCKPLKKFQTVARNGSINF